MTAAVTTCVYAGATDQGKWRTRNEDAYYIPDGAGPDGLLIVADGMGGYRAGNVASRMTVDIVRDMLTARNGLDEMAAEERIARAAGRANELVRLYAMSHEECRGMGSTLVIALRDGADWICANVGDSRAYHYAERTLRQVTVDHSLVQEMVDQGRLTREAAAAHIHRNVITRAVGVNDEVFVDSYRVASVPGSMMLLCSDGLNEHVSDSQIARILASRGSAEKKVRALIGLANKRGGRDNITVVLAACGKEATG